MVAIMLGHGGVSGWQGAVLGVDIFFVLSGFLITYLLIIELDRTGSIDRGAFWTRRARRLLPALFAVLIAVGLYSLFFATGAERDTIRGDGLASLFYVQNWRLIFSDQSYFAQFGVPSPLRHLWTLAVEEQWYVIWPLLFLALVRAFRGNLTRVAAVTLALAIASAVWMVILFDPNGDPSRVYYGTDTRVQTLLVGALLAFVFSWRSAPTRRWTRVGLQVLGTVSMVTLIYFMTIATDRSAWLYQGGFTLVAVLSAVLIAATTQPGPSRSVLRIQPLPWIGLISYGLYIWHWPIYVWLSPARAGLDGYQLMALRFAVTFAVATASFYLLEQPIRTGQWAWTRQPLRWGPAAAVIVVFCTLLLTSDLVAIQPANRAVAAGVAGGTNDPKVALKIGTTPQTPADIAALKAPPRPGATRVLVAGDSVAYTASGFYALPKPIRNELWVRTGAIPGCGITRGDGVSDGVPMLEDPKCAAWPEHYRERMAEVKPEVSVLLVGAWELFDRQVDGRTIAFKTPEMESELRDRLDQAEQILTANGSKMVLLSAPCFSPDNLALGIWGEKERAEGWRVDWLNQVFARWAADHPGVAYRDLHAHFCPGGEYTSTIGGKEVRYDGIHFSKAGANELWKWLGPQVRQLATSSPAAATG